MNIYICIHIYVYIYIYIYIIHMYIYIYIHDTVVHQNQAPVEGAPEPGMPMESAARMWRLYRWVRWVSDG